MTAYRRAYAKEHGDPPAAFHVHHLCGNNQCVNPAHLIAVSGDDHRKLHARPSFCDLPSKARLVREEQEEAWREQFGNDLRELIVDPFEDPDDRV